MLHRDLKSSNVLLSDGLTCKLADFGLGLLHKNQGGDISKTMTIQTDEVAGTLTHMAPECFGGRFSPRSDVYALGMVRGQDCFVSIFETTRTGFLGNGDARVAMEKCSWLDAEGSD